MAGTSSDVDRAIRSGTAAPITGEASATLERISLRREQLSQIGRVFGGMLVIALAALVLGLWSASLVIGLVAGVNVLIAGAGLLLNRHQRRNAEQTERLTRDTLHRRG